MTLALYSIESNSSEIVNYNGYKIRIGIDESEPSTVPLINRIKFLFETPNGVEPLFNHLYNKTEIKALIQAGVSSDDLKQLCQTVAVAAVCSTILSAIPNFTKLKYDSTTKKLSSTSMKVDEIDQEIATCKNEANKILEWTRMNFNALDSKITNNDEEITSIKDDLSKITSCECGKPNGLKDQVEELENNLNTAIDSFTRISNSVTNLVPAAMAFQQIYNLYKEPLKDKLTESYTIDSVAPVANDYIDVDKIVNGLVAVDDPYGRNVDTEKPIYGAINVPWDLDVNGKVNGINMTDLQSSVEGIEQCLRSYLSQTSNVANPMTSLISKIYTGCKTVLQNKLSEIYSDVGQDTAPDAAPTDPNAPDICPTGPTAPTDTSNTDPYISSGVIVNDEVSDPYGRSFDSSKPIYGSLNVPWDLDVNGRINGIDMSTLNDVTNNKTDLTTLTGKVNTLTDSTIPGINTNISNVDGRITTLINGDITNIKTDLTNLKNSTEDFMHELEGDMKSLKLKNNVSLGLSGASAILSVASGIGSIFSASAATTALKAQGLQFWRDGVGKLIENFFSISKANDYTQLRNTYDSLADWSTSSLEDIVMEANIMTLADEGEGEAGITPYTNEYTYTDLKNWINSGISESSYSENNHAISMKSVLELLRCNTHSLKKPFKLLTQKIESVETSLSNKHINDNTYRTMDDLSYNNTDQLALKSSVDTVSTTVGNIQQSVDTVSTNLGNVQNKVEEIDSRTFNLADDMKMYRKLDDFGVKGSQECNLVVNNDTTNQKCYITPFVEGARIVGSCAIDGTTFNFDFNFDTFHILSSIVHRSKIGNTRYVATWYNDNDTCNFRITSPSGTVSYAVNVTKATYMKESETETDQIALKSSVDNVSSRLASIESKSFDEYRLKTDRTFNRPVPSGETRTVYVDGSEIPKISDTPTMNYCHYYSFYEPAHIILKYNTRDGQTLDLEMYLTAETYYSTQSGCRIYNTTTENGQTYYILWNTESGQLYMPENSSWNFDIEVVSLCKRVQIQEPIMTTVQDQFALESVVDASIRSVSDRIEVLENKPQIDLTSYRYKDDLNYTCTASVTCTRSMKGPDDDEDLGFLVSHYENDLKMHITAVEVMRDASGAVIRTNGVPDLKQNGRTWSIDVITSFMPIMEGSNPSYRLYESYKHACLIKWYIVENYIELYQLFMISQDAVDSSKPPIQQYISEIRFTKDDTIALKSDIDAQSTHNHDDVYAKINQIENLQSQITELTSQNQRDDARLTAIELEDNHDDTNFAEIMTRLASLEMYVEVPRNGNDSCGGVVESINFIQNSATGYDGYMLSSDPKYGTVIIGSYGSDLSSNPVMKPFELTMTDDNGTHVGINSNRVVGLHYVIGKITKSQNNQIDAVLLIEERSSGIIASAVAGTYNNPEDNVKLVIDSIMYIPGNINTTLQDSLNSHETRITTLESNGSNYAASNHTHSNYAASNHTHDLSGYAPKTNPTFTGTVYMSIGGTNTDICTLLNSLKVLL